MRGEFRRPLWRISVLGVSSFTSTHSQQDPTTLAEYVERMKDGQQQIFYATGESRHQLLNSPHLEAFKPKGYEVLLLTDPVDEIWVGAVTEFDGKPLQSVAKGEVDLDSEDEKTAHEAERQDQERDFADLLTWLKETLSDHVKEVRLSTRLTESPACLITDAFGITPALARMYRASGQAVPVGKRILELNPESSAPSPACNRRRKRVVTMPKCADWLRPPNCFTAQLFSPRAARWRIPRNWPDCSPTGWPALCQTHGRFTRPTRPRRGAPDGGALVSSDSGDRASRSAFGGCRDDNSGDVRRLKVAENAVKPDRKLPRSAPAGPQSDDVHAAQPNSAQHAFHHRPPRGSRRVAPVARALVPVREPHHRAPPRVRTARSSRPDHRVFRPAPDRVAVPVRIPRWRQRGLRFSSYAFGGPGRFSPGATPNAGGAAVSRCPDPTQQLGQRLRRQHGLRERLHLDALHTRGDDPARFMVTMREQCVAREDAGHRRVLVSRGRMQPFLGVAHQLRHRDGRVEQGVPERQIVELDRVQNGCEVLRAQLGGFLISPAGYRPESHCR